MSLTLTGKITKIGEEEWKSDSFKIREFVIETPGEYPQLVKFQLAQAKTDLINNKSVGDTIEVHFDIRGNEYQGRVFNNLNCWKIE